jgi:hypothetical protein
MQTIGAAMNSARQLLAASVLVADSSFWTVGQTRCITEIGAHC